MVRVVNARAARRRDLVRATRTLSDARGALDAPVEEIAREAGIARGLIYREFASKEELYVATVCAYLDELAALLETAVSAEGGPDERLERCVAAFAGYCRRYPAFLDASQSLMRGPARDLRSSVSDAVWLQLGRCMASCLGHLTGLLRDEHFGVADPDFTANVLWTQALGTMHLARVGVGVRGGSGIPELFRVDPDRVVGAVVAAARATVRGQ